MENVVVVDVETTGLSPFENQVTALAFVPVILNRPPLEVFVDHEELNWTEKAFEYFQKYKEPWGRYKVLPGEAVETICSYFNTFSDEVTLCGHNVGFDKVFMDQLLAPGTSWKNCSYRTLDTHTLLYALVEQGELHPDCVSLGPALEAFSIKTPEETRHTAIGDARATARLLPLLLQELQAAR